jgi:putative endonuclease
MGSGPGPIGPPRNDCYRVRMAVVELGGRAVPYCVYLLASRKHGTLYLEVTNDLVRRVAEHKIKSAPGFTAKYGVERLVWFEAHDDPTAAIAREKALKKWRRDWKIRLIEEQNPEWFDLFPGICN